MRAFLQQRVRKTTPDRQRAQLAPPGPPDCGMGGRSARGAGGEATPSRITPRCRYLANRKMTPKMDKHFGNFLKFFSGRVAARAGAQGVPGQSNPSTGKGGVAGARGSLCYSITYV